MRKVKYLLSICILLLLISGCIDNDDTYYLNPDGSGKVMHKALIQSANMQWNMGTGDELSDEEKLKNVIRDEIDKAQGVDSWQDVQYSNEGDAIRFEGTAYFKNINKLKFHNGGTKIDLLNTITFMRDGEYMILEIKSERKEKEKEGKNQTGLSEEEILAEIEKQKAEYQKSRMMITGLLGTMRIKRKFYLPGNASHVVNFEKQEDGSFVSDFQGSKILEVYDSWMNDDDLIRKNIEQGRNMMKDGVGGGGDDKINEITFGTHGPIIVEAEYQNQPLFDYDAEVALARQQYESIAEGLGIMPSTTVALAEDGVFKVAGVRIVEYSDSDNNIRAFNYGLGYTYAIYGGLPEEALKVTEGEITSIFTDTGEDILPQSDWDRSIRFPTLSKDKRVVLFEIEIKNVPPNAKKFIELSGTINYMVGESIKKVDLNIMKFEQGAKGTEFSALVESLGTDDWDPNKQAIAITLDKSHHEIRAMVLTDTTGKPLNTESRGETYYGNKSTYKFSMKDGSFPSEGSVVVEVYEDLKKYKLPFRLTNLEIFKLNN